MEGDITFIGPSRLFAQSLGFNASQTVYKYRFNATDSNISRPEFGTSHGDEIENVLKHPGLKTNGETTRTVEIMSRSWISFINDLTPNNHGIEGGSIWDEYSGESTGMDFVFEPGNFHLEKDNYRQEGISLINDAVFNLG
jgi:carboxylesterase type B